VRTVDHDSASVDFPTGRFLIRAGNTWVNSHQGSGIYKTRFHEFQDSRSREIQFLDSPRGDHKEHPVGVGKSRSGI
jgi:hypothetical protein